MVSVGRHLTRIFLPRRSLLWGGWLVGERGRGRGGGKGGITRLLRSLFVWGARVAGGCLLLCRLYIEGGMCYSPCDSGSRAGWRYT